MDVRSFIAKGAVATKKPRKTVRAMVPVETLKTKVQAEVKKAIARAAENKQVGWVTENSVDHNSPIGPADCVPLVQQITTGASAQQRIGDRITPKRLKVSGVISWSPTDCNTQQNIYVRILLLSQKNIKTGTVVASSGVDTSRLLKTSIATLPESAFGGNTIDLCSPVNTELFRVYMDKTIKLTVSNRENGGVEAMPLYSARWSKTFKKSKLPASFTYDDGNGDWPNNFAPFLAIGYAYSDGTAPDTVTTKLVSNVLTILDYEDA